MKRTIIATGLVLAFAAAARAETSAWPPEKQEESVFTGRKLEVFKHGIKKEWGYAAPQRDTFLVLHPKQARAGVPLYVVLHSAGHDVHSCLACTATPGNHDIYHSPDDFFALYLDCRANRGDWWWGSNQYKNPEVSPTDKRVIDTVKWVIRQYGIDENRVYLCGNSMGGSGTLGIGVRHGDVFAAIKANVPAGVEHVSNRMYFPPRTVPAGVNLPDPPLVIDYSAQNDSWSKGHDAFVKAMNERKYPLFFYWGPFGHANNHEKIMKVNDLINSFDWLSVKKNEAYPAFTNASTNDPLPWPDRLADKKPGQVNAFFRWKIVRDAPDAIELSLFLVRPSELKTTFTIPAEATADVSLRRLQVLRVAPGETVRWTFGPARGEVRADAKGCITIPRLKITAEPATLSVEKAKQANVSPSDAAIAGPGGLGFDEIVFVKRKPYSSDHYYTDINSGTSPDRFVADNGIYVYNLRTRSERAVVRTADMPGGKGFIGKISLSFDAKKAVFDFRQDPGAGFRIWEVGIDGTGLRQISLPPPDEAQKAARWHKGWHTDDIHPCYLPDGKIIFSSTRGEHTVLCGGSAGLVAPGLHRMDADGSHVEPLTNSPVSEFCPVVLDDGRVMYHRWEYIDKGSRVVKSVWSMNPDGTRPQELFGLAHDATTIYMYPQPLPGSNHRFVCVGTCHYPQGGCLGAILLVDFGMGVRLRGPDPDEAGYLQGDDRYPAVNITPQVFVPRRSWTGWRFSTGDGKYVDDPEGRHGRLYTHPYPVSQREFLVSCKAGAADHFKNVANAYALYLIDTEGHERLVHADGQLSCWHPLPLVARPVPPQVQTARDPQYAARNQALCVVADVYQGMEGVKPGEVKWLRINESLPRYWSTTRRWSPSLSSSSWKAALWPRVQWGIVPVEKDGSAHFVVPADRAIFFQALDENYREIQRERTYVNYLPGEVRSCTGCHGQSNHTASQRASATPLALTRPPSTPQPQPCDLEANGGDGLAGQVIHYPSDIQPIFNAKCVSCHGAKDPAGGLRLTGEVTLFYNTSYEELASKELAGPIIAEFTSFRQGDRGNYNGAYLPPRSLGCPTSALIALLTRPAHPKNAKDDHSKMLSERELAILSRWVDTNYQFYGSYFGRQHPQWVNPDPGNPAYNPADFRRKATFEEATGFLAPPWHR